MTKDDEEAEDKWEDSDDDNDDDCKYDKESNDKEEDAASAQVIRIMLTQWLGKEDQKMKVILIIYTHNVII